MFDQPDHVIAEIAEQPRRHGGQAFGHLDPAFGQKRRAEFAAGAGQVGEGLPVEARLAVDPALGAVALPDQVRLHADDGIAPAHLAAR
jgi:hypothetical protein